MKRFIKIVFAFIALGTFALMFSSSVTAVNLTDEQMVEHDLSLVTVPDTAIISFPVAVKSPYGSQFKWSSSDEAVLEFMDGWFVVKRPSEEDAVVTVTVEVSRGEVSDIREFEVLVPAGETITRTFTITYLNVSEEEVAGLKKEYKLGEASFDLEAPIETGGKVFIGWFLDEDLTEEVTRVKVGTQGDLTFYAKWDVPATYKVVHYGEALEDGEYVVLETETFDSFVGREAIAEPLEFEGFTYAADHDLEVLEGVVPEEGILELKVYYTRNVYEVTFDTQGGSEIDPLTVKYGEVIEAPVPPTKVGYEFDGWNVEFPYEVKGDVTVTASWKAALVDYKVVYYGEKLDGTYEVVEEVFGKELTGTELTLTPDETFEGFEYFEHEDEVATQVIAADGTSEFAFYYKRL
ncbi:MAG TPA: hypothetical protein GXZ35_07470, partial [Acholeplasmataceae bacterium]|nr:hypothetical protein [Acholeplasmataceae bacterium]